jgi:competence ComEA-like helix-hairpin-helix protein
MTKTERNVVLWVCGAILVGSGIGAFQQAGRPKMEFAAGDATKSVSPHAASPVSSVSGDATLARGILPDGRIDLNTADEKMLDTLDGIGPAKARAIVENRTRYGPFRTVRDLDRVKGIGPSMLEKIGAKVGVETSATAGPLETNQFLANAPVQPVVTGPIAAARFTPPGSGADRGSAGGQPPVSTAVVPPSPPVVSFRSVSPGVPVNINTADMAQLMTLKYVGEARARAILQHRSVHGYFPSPESLDAVKGIGRQVLDANRGRIVVR